MCGICGVVGTALEPRELDYARRMREVLSHRGPDGHGEVTIAGQREQGPASAWIGHRRLRVIDLTGAAHQPMVSDDGAIALTYNGEVYNFAELRRELRTCGHRFDSTGDTEVILRGYEEWGDGVVSRLDGMFALGIWDARRSRLLLARDRTGKKPLFYVVGTGRLAFASEIKGLLELPWVDPEPDLGAVPEFLTFGYVPHPGTLYEDIFQVPPASTVVYDTDGVREPVRYWDALPRETRSPDRPLLREIARLLEDATRRRMVSDVPLGVLLSGGVDSSLIVGLMMRHATEPVRTFSIGFSDDATFDERRYARMVSDHFGTVHTEFVVQADAVSLMDRLLWHHDQPYADSSAIPTYLVCELAREHVTVALNGDGGDEVFGGYDRFMAAALAERLPSAVARMGRAASRLLPVDHSYYSRRRRAERFFELSSMPAKERYQSWISVLNEDLLADVLTAERFAPKLRTVTASMDACYVSAGHLPLLDQILYANFCTYLPDDLAVKMDRMSMAHSLETRSPFLDTELIACLAAVPAAQKVGLRRVKPLLRQAFRPMLPDAIWARRKHGFGVPMNAWFQGELGTLFEDEVLAPDARTRDILEPAAVRRIYDEHRSGTVGHGFRLWTLLTLERWLRTVSAPSRASPPAGEPFSAQSSSRP